MGGGAAARPAEVRAETGHRDTDRQWLPPLPGRRLAHVLLVLVLAAAVFAVVGVPPIAGRALQSGPVRPIGSPDS
jgi:hypothetical protein